MVMAAIQKGLEVGLSPMFAVANIAVINGRPSIYGDAFMAMCRAHPQWDEGGYDEGWEGEGLSLTAICTVQRKGGKPQSGRFSVADAKQAGLWGLKDNWKKHPKDMLMWRARTRVMRRVFADALGGLTSAEEAMDSTPMNVVVHDPGMAGAPASALPMNDADAIKQMAEDLDRAEVADSAPTEAPPPVKTRKKKQKPDRADAPDPSSTVPPGASATPEDPTQDPGDRSLNKTETTALQRLFAGIGKEGQEKLVEEFSLGDRLAPKFDDFKVRDADAFRDRIKELMLPF
jgi:hypothetical protein